MNLHDFQSDATRPPILHKDTEFTVRVPGTGHVALYRGPIPAYRAYGCLQFRRRDTHYHRNEAGYALSTRVLRKLRTLGCQLIVVAEEDTGYVYVFHESQYDQPVAAHNNPNHDDDPQCVAPLAEHWAKFPDHAAGVLVGEREHN